MFSKAEVLSFIPTGEMADFLHKRIITGNNH